MDSLRNFTLGQAVISTKFIGPIFEPNTLLIDWVENMCRKRFPSSQANYRVADLFTPPVEWLRGFDLVYECTTVQILAGSQRRDAIHAITDLVAPGGSSLVVSCRSRESEPEPNTFPIPLDHDKINKFAQGDLTEIYFLCYDDGQEPPAITWPICHMNRR